MLSSLPLQFSLLQCSALPKSSCVLYVERWKNYGACISIIGTTRDQLHQNLNAERFCHGNSWYRAHENANAKIRDCALEFYVFEFVHGINISALKYVKLIHVIDSLPIMTSGTRSFSCCRWCCYKRTRKKQSKVSFTSASGGSTKNSNHGGLMWKQILHRHYCKFSFINTTSGV